MVAPACAVVVRLDALGDSLLSLPAVEALARAWPRTRLVVVASALGAPVFRHCAEVWTPTDLGRRLREAAPGVVLAFTEKRVGWKAAWQSRAPIRVGFDPGRTQPLKAAWLRLALTHRVPWPNDLDRDPGLHEVERYFLLLEALGLERPSPVPPIRMPLGEEDRAFAEGFLSQFPSPPVALQQMPRWTAGGWPEELPGRVLEELPGPKLVLYAPCDRAWAEPWARERGVVGLAVPELGRYGAVLAGCRALVSPDGGAVHMASAVGTPVVALFPERHAAHCVRRWRPWAVEHRVVLRGDYSPGAEKDLARRLVASTLELDFGP